MKKITSLLAISMLFLCVFNASAQTDKEQEEAQKPVNEIVIQQMKISKLLKDAGTKSKALEIITKGLDSVSFSGVDSIDVEVDKDHVKSICLSGLSNMYLFKNTYTVVFDEGKKENTVSTTVNVNINYQANNSDRVSVVEKCIDTPAGYRILLRRIKK